ncbi:hypothetical protein Tco_0798160 [Tanacetum coccineum]
MLVVQVVNVQGVGHGQKFSQHLPLVDGIWKSRVGWVYRALAEARVISACLNLGSRPYSLLRNNGGVCDHLGLRNVEYPKALHYGSIAQDLRTTIKS